MTSGLAGLQNSLGREGTADSTCPNKMSYYSLISSKKPSYPYSTSSLEGLHKAMLVRLCLRNTLASLENGSGYISFESGRSACLRGPRVVERTPSHTPPDHSPKQQASNLDRRLLRLQNGCLKLKPLPEIRAPNTKLYLKPQSPNPKSQT